MSRDHLLSWHEKFQPLGPALKTPRFEVDEKSAIAEFERRSFDHPSCTGGNAPALSPQALVPSPAAQVFKVGDRVRGIGGGSRYWKKGDVGIVHSIDGAAPAWIWVKWDGNTIDDGIWAAHPDRLEHIQPSDTQQWVKWKGGKCPVSAGTPVEVRYHNGRAGEFVSTGGGTLWAEVVAYRVVQ